eukprot:188898_1
MESSSITLSAIEETSKKVSSGVQLTINNHVNNEKFDHQKEGLDFLETKNSLLLSYMIDLTQLMCLKSAKERDATKIEQCLHRLREMRTVLEKVKPLEKKMRYQLDKLLAISASSSSFAAAAESSPNIEEGEKMESKMAMESDPLAFRPNPDFMDGKDEGADSDDTDNENEGADSNSDDEDLLAARMAFKSGRDKEDEKNNVYKAPRLAAVPFTEETTQSEKEERVMKRQRDRMRKSELLSTVKSSFGDAPEEDDFVGGANLGKQRESSQRFADKEAERTKYEEETMVRLATSRNEKKMKKRMIREELSNLNSISDLGNLATGVSVAFGENRSSKSSKDPFEVEGKGSNRHVNGKRRRITDEFGGDGGAKRESRRNTVPKSSLQRELYGGGKSGGGKRRSKKK